MSSILRALKKVDGTQPEPRGTEAWSHRFDTAEAIRKRAGRSRGVRKAFALLLLMLVLGAGVWWFYTQPLTGKDSGQRVAGVTAGVEEKASSEARVGPRARVSVQRAPAPETAVKSESRPRPLSPDGSILPASVSESSSVSEEDRRRPATPAGGSEVAQAAPTSSAATEKSAGTGSIDSDRFKLEAIVWSNNPDSRFAVINGNILRVGGSMDGVTVTGIERDSVRIRSKNEVGELHFDLE